MKKNFTLLIGIMLASAGITFSQVTLSGEITSNMTLTKNNIYKLEGYVYVTSNATLSIEAGTVIKGDKTTKGCLIITRGAKIMAAGTASEPIVFTSDGPPGFRNRGDWGGIILLGYAPVNWPGDTGHIEGITPNPNTLYGGGANPNCGGGDCPDPHDNSGVLQYVRVEFSGIQLAPNNEINALTMGGVGDGTTIDHIQVSYANDDSYEWFGGTVNCKHLIAYSGIDDDWDTDIGYSGNVQFALGMRDPAVADVSKSNGFESDNDPTSSANTPLTSAVFQNVTELGGASITTNPLFAQGAHLRRNTNLKIYNSIIMGFPGGILIDGATTIANCAAQSLVENSYIQQNTSVFRTFTPTGDPNQPAAEANLSGNGNVYSTTYTGVLVNAAFPITDPDNLVPASGNPLPASNTGLYSNSFFTSVSYIGAFDPGGDNWADSWTNFDPQNSPYTGVQTPATISSSNIYPNPMTTSSTLEFNLAQSNMVNIAITDVAGRVVREVLNDYMTAGEHRITLNLPELHSGMYFVLVHSGDDNKVFKLNVE